MSSSVSYQFLPREARATEEVGAQEAGSSRSRRERSGEPDCVSWGEESPSSCKPASIKSQDNRSSDLPLHFGCITGAAHRPRCSPGGSRAVAGTEPTFRDSQGSSDRDAGRRTVLRARPRTKGRGVNTEAGGRSRDRCPWGKASRKNGDVPTRGGKNRGEPGSRRSCVELSARPCFLLRGSPRHRGRRAGGLSHARTPSAPARRPLLPVHRARWGGERGSDGAPPAVEPGRLALTEPTFAPSGLLVTDRQHLYERCGGPRSEANDN